MCKCEMCQLIETRRVLDQKIKQKRKRAGAGFGGMNEESEESITSLLLPQKLEVAQKKYKMEVTDGK